MENNTSPRNNGHLLIVNHGTSKPRLSNHRGEKLMGRLKSKKMYEYTKNVWHTERQNEKWTDLSKIWRIMRNTRAMGSATHKSRALAYTRPSRSSRSAQPRPSGNHSLSCQNQSLISDSILKHGTHTESAHSETRATLLQIHNLSSCRNRRRNEEKTAGSLLDLAGPRCARPHLDLWHSVPSQFWQKSVGQIHFVSRVGLHVSVSFFLLASLLALVF